MRDTLRDIALALGFSDVRFARVDGPADHAQAYRAWVAAGCHGEMAYLARDAEVRCEPWTRMPEARTAMVLAWPHAARVPPDPGGLTGRVARYAWGRDYHNLVGKRLRKLVKALRNEGHRAWGGVDTAPILERSWAARAGLGFSGKNSCQILPGVSSWYFLGVVFLDVEVAPDPPLGDHCGSCTRCLTGCPTDAFDGPRALDARRCIAYWTIESRELSPRALRAGFGRWFFGCDVCQEVCPHNGSRAPEPHPDLAPRQAWPDLPRLLATPDDALLASVRGTPLARPGAAGLKRNALVVLGNLGDPSGVDACREALSHPSPVVRGAAVWALGQLGDARVLQHRDPSPIVVDELRALMEVS